MEKENHEGANINEMDENLQEGDMNEELMVSAESTIDRNNAKQDSEACAAQMGLQEPMESQHEKVNEQQGMTEVTSLHDLQENFNHAELEQYSKAMKRVKELKVRLQSDMDLREEMLKGIRRRYGETLTALCRAKKACEEGKGSRELIAIVENCTREAERAKQAKLEKEELYRKLDKDDKKTTEAACARIWKEFGMRMEVLQEKFDVEYEKAWNQM